MEKILFVLLIISLAYGASTKHNFLSLKSEQSITNEELANQIFEKINSYRNDVGHMKSLEKVQTLEDTARTQVKAIIANIKSFGEFNDFSIRTEGHKLFGEIVAKIFDETDDTAQELWDQILKKKQITLDILREYSFGAVACEEYGNGWICVTEMVN